MQRFPLISRGLAIAGLLSAAVATHSAGGEQPAQGRAGEDWPMARRDASHSATTGEAIRPPLRWAWRRSLRVESQPIAAEGRVLIISAGHMVALSAEDGRTLWQTPLVDAPERLTGFLSAAIGRPYAWEREQHLRSPVALDGRVFVAANTLLYGLDLPSGRVLWRKRLWGPETPADEGPQTRSRGLPFFHGGFLTHYRGRLIVGTGEQGGRVMALDPRSGALIWRTGALESQLPRLEDVVVTLHAPVIDGSGRLYCRSEWRNQGVREAAGANLWRMDAFTGRRITRTRMAPVAAGKKLLLEAGGSADRLRLTARPTPPGGRPWSVLLGWPPLEPGDRRRDASPDRNTYAVAADLVVAAAPAARIPVDWYPNDTPLQDHMVSGIHAVTGARLWQARLQTRLGAPANVVLAGPVVYAFDRGKAPALTALDAATGEQLWSGSPEPAPRELFTQGPAISRGRLFIGTESSLYALESARPH